MKELDALRDGNEFDASSKIVLDGYGEKISDQVTRDRFQLPYSKIVDTSSAIEQSIHWRNEGNIVVVADAVLDIPHYRHADFLLRCANLGDKLILRVNSDEFVSTRKNSQGPIVSLEKRQKHAAHYPYVDLVTTKDTGGWDWLLDYKPNFVVKSITSGIVVLNEIRGVTTYLDKAGTRIIIMDEYANVISAEKFYEEGLRYEEDKDSPDQISGSIIKKEIIRRYDINKLL